MARAPIVRSGAGNIPSLDLSATPQPTAGGQDTQLAVTAAGARAFSGLGDRINALVERRNAREDQVAVDRATEAGTAAGDREPGVQMEGGGDLYRRAWQRSADEASSRRLQITARDRLDQLARDHEGDPEAFSRNAAAFRDGIAGSLPEGLRARFAQGFDTQALPFTNQLREQARQRTADQALASFNELLPRRIAAIERLATQAEGGDEAARAALAQEQDGLVNDLARLGPRGGFTFAGRTFAPDPTRSGARSVAQLQELFASANTRQTEAATVAAWRAAGGGAAWIDAWEARQTGQEGGTASRTVRDRIFRAENAAGDARQNPHSSASGPGQITRDTWNAYAARLGFQRDVRGQTPPPNRNDRAAHEAIFDAYMSDAQRAIGRPLSAGEQYAAWFLGIDGAKAFITAAPGTDARSLYGRVAGEHIAARAFATNGNLLRAGMTTDQVLAAVARRVGDGPADPNMPAEESRRIARRLRSEMAEDQRITREAQQQARAVLEPQMRENAAAIAATGRAVHTITDGQLAATGMDALAIRRYREAERAGVLGYQAGEELRAADTPEAVQAIADRFAPGGDLFGADPALASRILDRARDRGVHVRGAALAQRLADLTAEATATGEARSITREEGAAAGLTPEQVDRANRDLAKAGELGRITREGGQMPRGERQATRDRLRIEGEQAEENRARLEAYERAWRAQDEGLRTDPAGWALQGSRPAQQLARQVAQGDMAALPILINALANEQTRLGVAPADQKRLPKPIADALVQNVQQLPTAGERVQRVRAMLDQVEDPTYRRQVLAALGDAGLSEGVRIAAGAAPRIGHARAARLADELDTQARQLNVQPQQRRDAEATVSSTFDSSGGWFGEERLGALRAAQYAATGQAAFLRSAEEARDRLVRVALVRGAGAGGSVGSSAVREAYADLFGGVQIVNRPREGVVASVPQGTDANQVVRGLQALRDQAATRLFAGDQPGPRQARQALTGQAVWVDAGDGLALYHAGAPVPDANGRALVVTADQALAAAGLAARPSAPAVDDATAERRGQLRIARERAREAREFMNRGQQ